MKDFDISGAFGKFVIGAIALAAMMVWAGAWGGLTLSIIWGWFIQPVFNAPALTVLQAYGVCLAVIAAKGRGQVQKDDDGFSIVLLKAFFRAPLAAGATLACGYVAKSMM